MEWTSFIKKNTVMQSGHRFQLQKLPVKPVLQKDDTGCHPLNPTEGIQGIQGIPIGSHEPAISKPHRTPVCLQTSQLTSDLAQTRPESN
jgi:hypothetical protein